ncbi:MAG: thiamine-phosphate kinase [Sphingobacteriales bacterium]|nr:MAG: thiamine-phosphate kinase [Sphingobacteriales bacterium]
MKESVGEFALIQRYFAALTPPSASVVLGIGDDCALLTTPSGHSLAVSIDTQVEGVHFPAGAPAEQIGSRVACCALSDLAAIGATPLWATLALTLPNADAAWLEAFSRGLGSIFKRFDLALVGGDTTQGPLIITLQVHGAVVPEKALRRSGAKVGDIIYVTGFLGDGAAGLAFLQGKLPLDTIAAAYVSDRFYMPEPQLQAGVTLAGVASSAIDISDGLLADLAHIISASGVGAQVNIDQLPINPLWGSNLTQEQAQYWALTGGDDYQLCFTLSPNQQSPIQAHAIGVITEAQKLVCLRDGQPVVINQGGYEHFN